MIDGVATAARGASLKANQLRQQARMVKQVDLARVDGGQQIAIEIRLRLQRGLVADAVVAESFFRPFSRISVAANTRHAVGFKVPADWGRYNKRPILCRSCS